jgi:hypothetical protein
VRHLFVGTHSRTIEGDLIELLWSRRWRLLREQPCVFDLNRDGPVLNALTIRDGGQFWANPSEG